MLNFRIDPRRSDRQTTERPRTLLPGLALLAALLGSWTLAGAVEFNPHWGTAGVFSDAESCASCHRASSDQDPNVAAVMRNPLEDSGEDISPSYQWRHSIMAHAFDDPYYQASVENQAALLPALAGFIEDKCLTCHAPMAHTNAHQSGTDLTQDASCTLPNGCYRLATAETQDHARAGVSCTLCHQIKADDLGTEDSFSGGFTIAAAGDVDALTIYGPYQNPHAGGADLMLNNSGYTPMFGAQHTSSEHCATCHTLYTPTIDVDDNEPTGDEFLEQGAFLEWQNSVYATGASDEQQCQDCHMPDPAPGAYSSRIAVRPNGSVHSGWPERAPFYTHSMVGGNTHMLELLRDNRATLEIANSTTVDGFDEKIAQTRRLLENATAELDITALNTAGDTLSIDVRIRNKTGHKLPTGYPSRRMWIHLSVRNSANQLVFESGAPDAQGRIGTDNDRLAADCLALSKPAGFSDDDCYEPHRDLIDAPSQIAIYETVLGNSNEHITYSLLHAARYLKDNRIPPEGFTNSRAESIESQTIPSGVDDDSDFNQANSSEGSGSDTVHYRVSISDPNAVYSVEVRLLYQAIQPGYVAGLQHSGTRTTSFKQMYAQSPPTVETLATTSGTSSGNTTPVAEAGADQAVAVNATVQLDGSSSNDADGDPLSCAWSFSSVPTGSQAVFSDPTAFTPSFTADQPGTYTVQLVVNDGTIDSAPDAVTISADAGTSSGTTTTSSTSSGGGGGCTVQSNSRPDPLLPALALAALGLVGFRQRRSRWNLGRRPLAEGWSPAYRPNTG